MERLETVAVLHHRRRVAHHQIGRKIVIPRIVGIGGIHVGAAVVAHHEGDLQVGGGVADKRERGLQIRKKSRLIANQGRNHLLASRGDLRAAPVYRSGRSFSRSRSFIPNYTSQNARATHPETGETDSSEAYRVHPRSIRNSAFWSFFRLASPAPFHARPHPRIARLMKH